MLEDSDSDIALIKDDSEDKSGSCNLESAFGVINVDPDEWLEETVWYGMRMWHVIFLSIGAVLSFIILLCCCFKFRIPRTKQEIEGDYIRRRIMRKFRKRLKAIQNQELDEMDLKKALDKIRTELKSDTESLQQSDVLSGATLSSAGMVNPGAGSTYRRASQIQIEISLEDLRIQSLGFGARVALAFNRFFGSSRKPNSSTEEEAGNGENTSEVGDKMTTALLPPKASGSSSKPDKKEETVDASKKKGKEEKKATEVGAASSSTQEKKKGEEKKEEKGKDTKTGTKKKDEPPPPTTIVTTESETKKPTKKDDKDKSKKEKAGSPPKNGEDNVKPDKINNKKEKEKDKTNGKNGNEKEKAKPDKKDDKPKK